MAKTLSDSAANTGTRGPQVFNESTDRTMKYYLVAEIEIKGLTRSEALTSVGLAGATAFATIATDSYRDYASGIASMLPWAIAFGVAAVPFLILAIVGFVHRRGILSDIRRSEPGTV